MYYDKNSNNNFNKEEFFQIYPPLNKKPNPEESNKFIKLFVKPVKKGPKKKKPNISQFSLQRNQSAMALYKSNLELIQESFNETNQFFSSRNSFLSSSLINNSMSSKTKQNENNEFSIEEDSNYYLINKGLYLQKGKKKRTHSIKKSLEKFLYNTNVIEKLRENLLTIETQKNNEQNISKKSNNDNINNESPNSKKTDNKDSKIKSKISEIVKKLSNQLLIEKVPENKFIIKMYEKGDNCYFLLSGKLSILKPVEYKNIRITYQDYILYLNNLLKYNEIELIEQILKTNHYFINIKSIDNLKIIIKGFFIDKIKKYLELFNTLTYDDIETILNNYNLTFEDFNLKKDQLKKDLNDIDNNTYKRNESYDSSSSERKKEEENLTKNMILKQYIIRNFTLPIEEKIILTNYNFLFNPKEEKKTNLVTLYKYEYFLYLTPGSFFGDMALESKVRKRNATIRTEEECFILSLSNDDYFSLLFEDNKKLKSLDLIFLNSKFFFTEISPVIFDKYYFALFKSFERAKGDIIYQQETSFSSIYFLKEGNIKLELNASIIDIHNLIKFFIDVLEEKNYLKFSAKKIEKLRNNYLNDKELLELRNKNYIYLQKFNERQKFEISTINKYECLGDLELFLTSGYIHTCTVVSQKVVMMEIKKKDLCRIFNEEKDVLPIYYQFVMNKLISQIKRLYYIKDNFINQIKSKVRNNYYDNIISPNFYDQIKNNNTSTYYDKKVELKKILPKVFNFAHFDPPIIFDSKFKRKKFDQERNRVYLYKQKENENKSSKININLNNSHSTNKDIDSKPKNEKNEKNSLNKNNIIYNLRFKKILEEASTAKTLSNSNSKSNSKNKKKEINKNKIKELVYQTQLKRSSSNVFFKNPSSSETIIAGKYHLSLSKLERQFNNNIEKNVPPNLNIVKNSDNEILKEKAILCKSPSIKDSLSSSSTIILPLIKKFKLKNVLKKRENVSQNKNTFVDITLDMNNESVKTIEMKHKANEAISRVVKNFYIKQRNNGYTSLINRHNNRYFKFGQKEIKKIQKNKNIKI